MLFNLRLKRSRHNRRKLSAKELWAERAAGLWSLSKSASVWVFLLGLLGAMGWVGVHTWQTGLRLEWVRVKRVVVEGNQHVTQAEVEAALDYRAGEPFLPMLDPQTSELALERLPWVANARVRKEFPDTVKVKVEERQVAGLAYMGGLRLVDTRGVPFKALGRGESLDVPIVTGLGSDPGALLPEDHERVREALLIARAYQEAGLERYDRLSEVEVDRLMGFTLVTEAKGTRVPLGEGGIEARLERLREVFELLERQKVQASEIRLDGERSLSRVSVVLK
jgi:cell division protein FtsQ